MSVVSIAAVPGLTRVSLPALPPLALYVHIPWCVRKCPYCDFNSHEVKGELPEEQYVQALTADLESALPLVWGRRVHSVFFGGGTPSLLSAGALDQILAAVRARLPLDSYAEITLEANPGTFEARKFADFRSLGINRLSVGIQSFDAAHLRALGRIHDEREARAAVALALETFDNVNLDLMYGLPGQSLEQAQRDIETAIGFGPRHISAYHLTIEPNTWFHRHPPALPADELSADMQEMIEERLAQAGYRHYETSAFARDGHQCRHNLNYWRFGDYLGIGAGAHGKLSFPDRVLRQARFKQPRDYMRKALAAGAVQEEREVSATELPFEFMMNALRLTDGFPLALFPERTGLSLTAVQRQLDAAEERGFIVRDPVQVRPTQQGQRFLNDLLQIFLPPPPRG